MYTIKDESQYRPMAIITTPDTDKIKKAVKEEFGYKRVNISLPLNFVFPDYGQSVTIYYDGDDENDITWSGQIELTNLISY